MKSDFHSILNEKADQYAQNVYKVCRSFPREEIYGLTSQLRRSALSVILNYIEGYARVGDKQYKHFLQMAYGSLKESQYLLKFSVREGYLSDKESGSLLALGDEIGAMLWTTIQGLNLK